MVAAMVEHISSKSWAFRFRYFSQNLVLLSSRVFCSESRATSSNEVETVYGIISSSQSSSNMKQLLKSSKVFLSNDLIDKVLKRVRFGHANPLQTFEFFNYTGNRKGFYHSAFSLDTMLYILGRSRMFDKIWDVLDDVRHKDQTIITSRTVMVVLARVAKVCSVRQTVESFRRFKRVVPEFDTDCFNALLRALCQEKSMTDARNVYHSLKHSFRPNLQTFNILLSGWKSSDEAEGFFEEMKLMGVKPDIVSYNCLIDVYCKAREIDKAYKVVEKMRKEDIMPDVFTHTSIIGGLGLVGQPDKARDVLKEMKEDGCYPDVAAYNAVIRNFCIAKRLGEAYSLMDEMASKGLNPNSQPSKENVPESPNSAAHDLNTEIHVLSTRINEPTEANENSNSPYMPRSDPNSAALDCRLCGASVGLWAFCTVPRPMPMELIQLVGYGEINGGNHSEINDSRTETNSIKRGEIILADSDITTLTKERHQSLNLTIAGGPPPTKQNFKATVSLPVIGRNLRARFFSDSKSRDPVVSDQEKEHVNENGDDQNTSGVTGNSGDGEGELHIPVNNGLVSHDTGSNLIKQVSSDNKMELDPVRQHRHFCPWIASTGKGTPGWKQTLSALQRQQRSSPPSSERSPLSSIIKVDDPLASVRNIFMSPSAKKRKCDVLSTPTTEK